MVKSKEETEWNEETKKDLSGNRFDLNAHRRLYVEPVVRAGLDFRPV
jgi:hypothetical protein